MAKRDILKSVGEYYSQKILQHGATHWGVDWNSTDSQENRYKQMLKLISKTDASVTDYGCGYAGLLGFMRKLGFTGYYQGYDISDTMITAANQQNSVHGNFYVTSSEELLAETDYLVANGIFSVKLDISNRMWRRHILGTIDKMSKLCKKGFAFNALTNYIDAGFEKEHLYYADPTFFFDYCKKLYSKNVALLHDYGLYEFTILVRKEL